MMNKEVAAAVRWLNTRGPLGEHWAATLENGALSSERGTLKAWMQAHDDELVDTLQLRIADDEVLDSWAPRKRLVDSRSFASYALLAGSRLDYAGARTLFTVDGLYVGWRENWQHLIVYAD